jgi:hypothetical protein
MSDRHSDPSGNTAQFQAFVQRSEPEPARRSPVPLILGLVVAVIVAAAVIAFFAMS